MRIDFGPNFDEIRDSVENGTVVTFGTTCGEQLRCVVLDAKMDCESGRAALTVENRAPTIYISPVTAIGVEDGRVEILSRGVSS